MMASQRERAPERTVLIAEDEPMLLMVVADTLRDAGYQVLEAANGEAALALLTQNPQVDLLMSDIRMPGINGYQLAQKSLELRPNLRILLMTGYAQDVIPKQIGQLGIPILYKPFDFEKLPELANNIMGLPENP
jgi:two-component system, cell cycle response regulator CpdR